jgi:hypothetical protein
MIPATQAFVPDGVASETVPERRLAGASLLSEIVHTLREVVCVKG